LLLSVVQAGCTTPAPVRAAVQPALPLQQTISRSAGVAVEQAMVERYQQLASALAEVVPNAEMRPVSDDSGAQRPVVRLMLDDGVLFDTNSDQPQAAGAELLARLVGQIRQAVPESQVTVLGHTDAVGSDAYNLALSRRRGLTVARMMVERGLPPNALSIVAVGKRQPVASNETPEGRAQNRRVEFLISPAFAANMTAAGGAPVASTDASRRASAVDVLGLQPDGDGSYAAISVTSVVLNGLADDDRPTGSVAPRYTSGRASPVSAAIQHASGGALPARIDRAAMPSMPPLAARPNTPDAAPSYLPRSLAPGVEPAPLGPATSY
jgi:outer membrane protein OmpA-like peptidoglycan-associated protein